MTRQEEEDEEFAREVLDRLHVMRARVHVRGTDASPVIELKDGFGRIVGGTEARRRLRDWGDEK
jgi:hypothetical protein